MFADQMKIKMFADLQLSRRYLFLLDNELITPVSNCQVWLIIFFSASVKGTFPRFANGTLAVPSCLQFTFFFKNRWAVFPGNWEFGFKGREVLLHSAAVMQQGEVFKPALKNSFEKSFREIYALVSEELCACPLPSIGIRPPGPQQKLHSQTMQFKILEASVCKVCLCQSLLCSYINTFVFYPHPFTLAFSFWWIGSRTLHVWEVTPSQKSVVVPAVLLKKLWSVFLTWRSWVGFSCEMAIIIPSLVCLQDMSCSKELS